MTREDEIRVKEEAEARRKESYKHFDASRVDNRIALDRIAIARYQAEVDARQGKEVVPLIETDLSKVEAVLTSVHIEAIEELVEAKVDIDEGNPQLQKIFMVSGIVVK